MRYLILFVSLLAFFGCKRPEPKEGAFVCITPFGTAQLNFQDPNIKENKDTISFSDSGRTVSIPKSLCVKVEEN